MHSALFETLLYISFSFLFFVPAAQALSDVYSDLGSGPILLDNVGCSGYEERLVDCRVEHNALEDYHSEDAGVRCFNLSGE